MESLTLKRIAINGGGMTRKIGFISPAKREFALYKKGEFVTSGTRKHLAKFLGVKKDSVAFYGSKTYERRTTENAMRIVEITGWDKDEN